MNLDAYGLVYLVVSVIDATVILVLLLLGAVFAMHRWMRDQIPEHVYGRLDMDDVKSATLIDMVIRLAILCFVPTVIIHLLAFVFVGTYLPLPACRYTAIPAMILLEVAGMAAGFYILFRLDRMRLAILTSVSGVLYILLLWLFLYSKLR